MRSAQSTENTDIILEPAHIFSDSQTSNCVDKLFPLNTESLSKSLTGTKSFKQEKRHDTSLTRVPYLWNVKIGTKYNF